MEQHAVSGLELCKEKWLREIHCFGKISMCILQNHLGKLLSGPGSFGNNGLNGELQRIFLFELNVGKAL